MTKENSLSGEYAIIATKPCGCVTCIVWDKPQYVEAETILEWVHAGLKVERVPAESGRKRIATEFNCDHAIVAGRI